MKSVPHCTGWIVRWNADQIRFSKHGTDEDQHPMLDWRLESRGQDPETQRVARTHAETHPVPWLAPCYIRVIKSNNVHLFFQVTTPSASPFDADIGTPEGETFNSIKDKNELLKAINQIMQRPRTTEVVNYLLRLA
jgi:hypothetical protein